MANRNDTFLLWAEAHGNLLWKVVRSFAGPREWQELHQDLLIAVWEAIPAFHGGAKVSTFIYRVACNRALNWARLRRTRRDRFPSLESSVLREAPAAEPGTQHQQRLNHLYTAIHGLPEIDRMLVLLYLDECSYREISEICGISETNVGVRLNRIKKRLKGEVQ